MTLTAAHVRVVREPLRYERSSPHSYFRDTFAAELKGDRDAIERLARHRREMALELERRNSKVAAAFRRAGFEARANPNPTPGQGGYFDPPLWLVEQFGTMRRPGRVLPDLVKAAGCWFPLPSGTSSINLPLLTTGTTAQPQVALDADTDTDIVDTPRSSPVVTVSGQKDVALQLLEQSPQGAHLDWALFTDLSESYDADLSVQAFYGTGTGGHFTGIVTAAPASNQTTYTNASPTLSGMYPVIGQTMAAVGDNRNMPPTAWLMRTARWAWIGSSLDDQHRPIVTPDLAPPPEPRDDGPTPSGSIFGLPVYLSDSISATLGTAANQDQIVAARPSDVLLFEGTPKTSAHLDVLSGTLQARLVWRAYAALVVRQPTGTAVLGGSGLTVATGF